MKLITEVRIPDYPFQLDYDTPVLMLGSCFAEEIGRILHKNLFPVSVNPFGVTYNPGSVLRGLKSLKEKDGYVEDDLDEYSGMWFSFDHYTRFSDPDKNLVLERINQRFLKAKTMLTKASTLMITWGTAWVYRYGPEQRVVNNCHKLPSREFSRERLTPEKVVEAYLPFLKDLFIKQPELNVLLTVSPVRHWKDGAHGNQLSKATLLLAADALVKHFPGRCFYFPSYELVMDEMRDYRYYGADLVHLNETATGYIWEKFSLAVVSDKARKIMRELEPMIRLNAHRPIRTGGSDQQQLEEKKIKMHRSLQVKYPHLAWTNWAHFNT